jgi:hypothetical protein
MRLDTLVIGLTNDNFLNKLPGEGRNYSQDDMRYNFRTVSNVAQIYASQ